SPSRISTTSRWPSVVNNPTLAPLCSRSALVATVVPCTMRSVCASIAARSRPIVSASNCSPSRTPTDGSDGVDGTLVRLALPAPSTATRSVKVPPTSIPMRYIIHLGGRLARGETCDLNRSHSSGPQRLGLGCDGNSLLRKRGRVGVGASLARRPERLGEGSHHSLRVG